jgi:RNA polymerase sigma factor (sigma-70 family)
LGGQSEETSDPGFGADLVRKRRLLGEAMDEHRHRLLSDCRIYVKRFGLASEHDLVMEWGENVLQDAAEVAVKKLEEFDDSRSPLPWLRAIAQNVVRNRLAEKRRGSRAFPVTDYVPRAGAAESRRRELESPTEQEEFEALLGDDEAENTVSGLRVDEILSLVPEGPRRVLCLHFVEGLRGKALAARLGTTPGSASVALNRAKKQLFKAHQENAGEGPPRRRI